MTTALDHGPGLIVADPLGERRHIAAGVPVMASCLFAAGAASVRLGPFPTCLISGHAFAGIRPVPSVDVTNGT